MFILRRFVLAWKPRLRPAALGGSGTSYWLHVLDARPSRAFNDDGSTYGRLDLAPIRSYVLADRWEGDIRIEGNTIRIETQHILGGSGAPSQTIEARRP